MTLSPLYRPVDPRVIFFIYYIVLKSEDYRIIWQVHSSNPVILVNLRRIYSCSIGTTFVSLLVILRHRSLKMALNLSLKKYSRFKYCWIQNVSNTLKIREVKNMYHHSVHFSTSQRLQSHWYCNYPLAVLHWMPSYCYIW